MIAGTKAKLQKSESGSSLNGNSLSAWDVFECLPVSAAVIGPDGLVKKVNRKWREFAVENGLKDLSLACEGASYLECCRRAAREGDDFAAQALKGILSVLTGEAVFFALEYPCHSPTINRWFLMKATPAPAGHAVALHLDITERKLAEEAMVETERNFRLIAETIEDVFWITTPAAEKIVYVSPAYEKIWGRDREGLYEDPKLFLDTLHPDDREGISTALFEIAQGVWDHHYRIVRPDGGIRWIHDRGFPIRDSEDRVLLMTGVATDITERRRLEDEIKRSRDELELRIQERTRTLEEANTALRLLLKLREEDRQISREAVLANVRHSILPYLRKLKGCKLPDEAASYLELIETKIGEITSSFVRTISDKFLDLTPMEIRVGALIRDGRSTKEIAELLHLAPGTIRYHRENLRQKLGIKSKAFNLRTILLNLE